MTLLLVSFLLTGVILAATLPFGITPVEGRMPVYMLVTSAMTWAHFIISDIFHWGSFSNLEGAVRNQRLIMAGAAVCLFMLMLQTGVHYSNLLFMYFFAHFWKDIDLGFARSPGSSSTGFWGNPKLVLGAVALMLFVSLRPSFVADPDAIAVARRVTWCVSAVLISYAVMQYAGGLTAHRPPNLTRSHFSILAGSFLLVFTWMTTHPHFASYMKAFFFLAHYMGWYVFYWYRAERAEPAAENRRGMIDQLKHSRVRMVMLVAAINLVLLGGAWVYASISRSGWPFHALNFFYDPDWRHLLGFWTVLHITGGWPTRKVRGVRVGF